MSRRSSREKKPSSKIHNDHSLAPVPVSPPKHPSTMPIDASIYGVGYLKRQIDSESNWVPHLDFVRLESDAIKELFWTDRHQKKHGEFIPPPKALQRDVKTIKNFLESGNRQKNQDIAKYKQFDEQLINESNDVWDVSDITAAYETMDTEPTPCKGVTFQDIEESTQLSQERKDEIKIGMCQLIRQSFSTKYKQTGSNAWSYCVPVTGTVVKGARNEVAWLVEELPMSNVRITDSINTNSVSAFASAKTIDGERFIYHHTIRDINCTGNTDTGRQCSACVQSRRALLRRCTQTVQLRSKPLDEKTTHLVLAMMSKVSMVGLQIKAE